MERVTIEGHDQGESIAIEDSRHLAKRSIQMGDVLEDTHVDEAGKTPASKGKVQQIGGNEGNGRLGPQHLLGATQHAEGVVGAEGTGLASKEGLGVNPRPTAQVENASSGEFVGRQNLEHPLHPALEPVFRPAGDPRLGAPAGGEPLESLPPLGLETLLGAHD